MSGSDKNFYNDIYKDLFTKEAANQRFYLIGDIDEKITRPLFVSLIRVGDMTDILRDDKLTLYIDSDGGDVWSVHMLANYIEEKGNITTVCLGRAFSGGLHIFVAGDNRIASKDSLFLYHEMSYNTRDGHENQKLWLEKADILQDRYDERMAQRTKKSKKFWKNMRESGKDNFFNAKEAIKWGVAHKYYEI